jgi:hypothetical protein
MIGFMYVLRTRSIYQGEEHDPRLRMPSSCVTDEEKVTCNTLSLVRVSVTNNNGFWIG